MVNSIDLENETANLIPSTSQAPTPDPELVGDDIPRMVNGSRISALSCLRLVAAWHIVMRHSYPLVNIWAWGYAWLTFFFVTSGFLVLWTESFMDTTPRLLSWSTGAKILKRGARLLPMYWMAMLWNMCFEGNLNYLCEALTYGHTRNIIAFCAELFCVQGWWSTWAGSDDDMHVQNLSSFHHINFVSWFVSVLWLYVLISPFVIVVLRKIISRLGLQMPLILLAAWPILSPWGGACPFWDMFIDPVFLRSHPPPLSLACLSMYISGMVFAELLKTTKPAWPVCFCAAPKKYLGSLALLMFFIPMITLSCSWGICAFYWQLTMQVPSVLLLLWGISNEEDWLSRLLSRRPLCWGEKAAYGVYIFQVPVWNSMEAIGLTKTASYDAMMLVYIVCLTLVAFLIHQFVEVPLTGRLVRIIDGICPHHRVTDA